MPIEKRQGMEFVAAFSVDVELEADGDRVLVKEITTGRIVAFITKLGVVSLSAHQEQEQNVRL